MCCHGIEHAIHVVQVSVLHCPMHLVLGHRHLRPIEHTRLVHVVPGVGVQGGALVHFELVLVRKVVPSLLIQEVWEKNILKYSVMAVRI